MSDMRMDQLFGAILVVLIGLVVALSLLMVSGMQLRHYLGATVATCPGDLCPVTPVPDDALTPN